MHKIILSAALAGTALGLSACGETFEDVSETEAMDGALTEADSMDTATDATPVVLDANVATTEQLTEIGDVSPELAEAIVAGQPYASVVELNAVLMESLSEAEAAAVRTNVFVPIDLNSASREAIALVPGMTERMVGEFLEYRPYENIDEFDREIGKYVDEEEVARFRNYVTL